ncbi:hypothetical protein MKW94_019492 [Papaver nudicaule]|uniref:HECT-type E3 ubiquitin transferase n=1 Tax=Papaver nudicaule TaxID=74823 RepID=A0AA41VA92_PAPNU|nr:hypothetical protein [Papaver nudicaule]
MGDCESENENDFGTPELVWRSKEETKAARDLVSSIPSFCSSCETDPDNSENSSVRAKNIVSLVNEYLSMIPSYNIYDSEKHMFMLISSGTAKALVSLVLNSQTQCYKQSGEESIKLFLYPNIRFVPKSIRKHWVRLVLKFCDLLYCEDKHGDQHPLYYTCRKTLISLLKLTSFRKTSKYTYATQPSDTIEEFYPFVKDYFVYSELSYEFIRCLANIRQDIWNGRYFNFTPRWPSYLSLLRELKKFSKIYLNEEEDLFSEIRGYQYQVDMLVRLSKRSDDLKWLLEHKNSISSNTRDYLLMKMLPEVKFDFEKHHKMLIDRSQILTDSFKHLSLGTSKSLHSGLSVEFRNEEAVGYGVLREWFFVICQELFDPKGSLFLACPTDGRRFFPNPAPLDHRHRNYYAFAGRVIALALMHKVQVGVTFDRVFFLQLAGGVISLEDIQDADPVLYKSFKTILEMDADIVDSYALGLTFVREFEEFGSRRVVELCPGGDSIIVNSKNREEYIQLLIQHCFVKSIAEKLSYFTRGFGDILCERELQKIFFQSLELEDLDLMLLGSSEAISVIHWKAHTVYHGYEETDDQIRWFWEVYSYRRSIVFSTF